MSTWIDLKYLNLISHRLDRFSWVRQNRVARTRCPICGDSHTDKTKARGYFLVSSDVTVFYCQNCNANLPISKFLEYHFPTEYQEYRLEMFRETLGEQKPKEELDLTVFNSTPKFVEKDFLSKNSVNVHSLPDTHLVNVYLKSRRISFPDLWYIDNFKELVLKFEDSYERLPEEPRLIIPFRNETGELTGFQGRALLKRSKMRYITIKKDVETDIVFGLDRVDFSKNVFVLEGALDSTFIPNSIAVNGSSLQRLHNMFTKDQMEKCIFLFDNEPRNPQIVRNMKVLLESGYRVVVWNTETEKDVNNILLSGVSMVELIGIIRSSICSGLSGIVKLNNWKRV